MTRHAVCLSIAAICSTLVPSLATAAPGDVVIREGTGDRRQALDAMELAPFDQSLWAGLTDWFNGEPVTPDTAAGKVVVIYTWAGYLPTAVRPISIVNRLADKHADDLIVVGVHDDQGYEDGKKQAERRRAAFRIARDAGNTMRRALRVDQDPDFYVIDRSGRVRFADIDTGSLERAVSMLIDESTTDAESLLDRMAQADAAQAEAARRSAKLRSQIDLSELPWVDFAQPGEDEYKQAPWPEKKVDENANRSRRRRGAPSGPATLNYDAEGEWSPAKPQHTKGRATLIYLFTPDIMTQFSRGGFSPVEVFQAMDQIQQAHARDLQVIGVMTRNVDTTRRSRRRDESQDAEQAKSAKETFDQLMRDLPVAHTRLYDPAGGFIVSKLSPDNGGSRSTRRGGFALPYYIIASSDGMVRWHGALSSTERAAEWQAALDTVLRVDPGIKARKQAEEDYITSLTD